MLYKQENITLVDEVRKTGRGNRVWIEILKFLAVLTPINLIMVFAGEAIKAALFQKSVINEEISMIIQLYECALGIGLVVLYCCCIEKRTFMSMGFMKRDGFPYRDSIFAQIDILVPFRLYILAVSEENSSAEPTVRVFFL